MHSFKEKLGLGCVLIPIKMMAVTQIVAWKAGEIIKLI